MSQFKLNSELQEEVEKFKMNSQQEATTTSNTNNVVTVVGSASKQLKADEAQQRGRQQESSSGTVKKQIQIIYQAPLTDREEPKNCLNITIGKKQDADKTHQDGGGFLSLKNASQAIQMQFDSTSRDLTLENCEAVTLGASTTLQLREPSHEIETPRINGKSRQQVPQEVQTSFQPSIKDSAEFKKFGQSILKMSEEKQQLFLQNATNVNYEEAYCSRNINFKDFETGDQQNYLEGYTPNANEQFTKRNPSTKRKPSLPSDNQSSQIGVTTTLKLPNQGFQNNQVSHYISGKRSSSKQNSSTITHGGRQQQVLRQIYISVNTYEQDKKKEERSNAAKGSADGLRAKRKSHSSNAIVGVATQQEGPCDAESQIYLPIRPRSRELSNERNKSLIIQPVLLGVRAVNRTRQSRTLGNDNAATPQTTKAQCGVTELIFDETQINSRRNARNSRKQNLPTRVKIKTVPKTTTTTGATTATAQATTLQEQHQSPSPRQTIVGQHRRAQSMPLGDGNDIKMGISPPTAVDFNTQSFELRAATNSQEQRQQLILGPQIVSNITTKYVDQKQIITGNVCTDQQQECLYGNPVVIDAKSRMGRHFLAEQRLRRIAQKKETNANWKRLDEIKKLAEVKVKLNGLNMNKRPAPPKAKQIESKVSAQMKREELNKEMQYLRDIAWKEHLWEENQKQLKSQNLMPLSQERPDTLMSTRNGLGSNRQYMSPDQGLLSNRLVGDIGSKLEPWNNNLNSKAYSRPLSSSSNKSLQPPSTINRQPLSPHQDDMSYTQLDDKSKYRMESQMIAAKEQEGTGRLSGDGGNAAQDIQDIIYKTLNQTDILSSAELQESLSYEQDGNMMGGNPNAIVLRVASLKEIAPVLHEGSIVNPAGVGTGANVDVCMASGDYSQIIAMLTKENVNKMNTFEFADTIRQMYLPFTLRQMYYKELKRRKPIFLGASKKGVGFSAPQLINERTSLAQTLSAGRLSPTNATATAKVAGTAAATLERHDPDSCNHLCRNQNLVISSARLYAKKDQIAMALNQNVRDIYRKDAGTFILAADEMDRESLDKGIDMQSFGAMTGVDPFAVKEIEQLMQVETNTDFKDVSNKPQSLNSNAAYMNSRGEYNEGASTVEQKKSKVIFSVKKRDKEDSKLTIYKRRSGTKTNSSDDTGGGHYKAGSALSQPSSKLSQVLDPRSKQFSPEKKNYPHDADANKLTGADYNISNQRMKKNFKLQYATKKTAFDDKECETYRTPEQERQKFVGNKDTITGRREPTNNNQLRRVNVSNVQIRVSRDQQLQQQSDQSKSPVDYQHIEGGRSMTGFQIRSFTCVDLEENEIVKGRNNGRLLKSSISDGLHRATSQPEGKLSKGCASKNYQQDQMVAAQKKPLNVASISNIGSHQKNQTSLTGGMQEGQPRVMSLPPNLDWTGAAAAAAAAAADQEDTAEIGTPLQRQEKLAQKRTLSPKILNLELPTTGAFNSDDKIPNQLTSSVHMSTKFQVQHNNQGVKNCANTSKPEQIDLGSHLNIKAQQSRQQTKAAPMRKRSTRSFKSKSKSRMCNSPIERNSRGSFYISEDSQRTLTPLSCKEHGDIAENGTNLHQHSQGFIMHRGNKFYQMQRLRHKRQGRSDSRLSRCNSSHERKNIYHKHPPQQRSNCIDCNKNDYDEMQQIPDCTCSKALDRSQKFDQQQVVIQKQSSSSSTGKNRVVFVVRNQDQSQASKAKTTNMNAAAQKNTDLIHLPIGSDCEANYRTQQDNPSETVFNHKTVSAAASVAKVITTKKVMHSKSREGVQTIPSCQNEVELKKSSSNMFGSTKQSIHKVLRSYHSNQDESQNSHNYNPRQEASDGKCLSNQSSAILTFSQMMPAVCSQKSVNPKLNNTDYADMINLKQRQPAQSGTVLAGKANLGSKKPVAKVQVQMRLSKNPNQCPPRFTRRRPSSHTRPQSTMPKITVVSAVKPDISGDPNGIISIQVQNDPTPKMSTLCEKEKSKKPSTLKHPNYNTLQPYTIISSEQLSETVLSKAAADDAADDLAAQRQELQSSAVLSDGLSQNHHPDETTIDRKHFMTLNDQIDKILSNKQRPQSQYAAGSARMNRLQRFYQTQRGKNIMSIASKRSAIDFSSKEVTLKQANQTTLHETQHETQTSLNETELRNMFSNQTMHNLSIVFQSRRSERGLKMIGKTATVATLSELPIGSRNCRHKSASGVGKADAAQSIQRFSIHLSPASPPPHYDQNQEKKVCKLHSNPAFIQHHEDSHVLHKQEAYVERERVTPMRFLPTLPENQQKAVSQCRRTTSRVNSATNSGKTGDDNRESKQQKQMRRGQKSRTKSKTISLTSPPSCAIPSSSAAVASTINLKTISQRAKSRPTTTQKNTTSNAERTANNSQFISFSAATSSLTKRPSAQERQRIVRGLASRHFNATAEPDQPSSQAISNHPVKAKHLRRSFKGEGFNRNSMLSPAALGTSKFEKSRRNNCRTIDSVADHQFKTAALNRQQQRGLSKDLKGLLLKQE